jgi:hypothetical protein
MKTITIIPRYFVRFGPWDGRNIRLTIIASLMMLCTITVPAQLSVETLGVIRHQNITDGEDYGVSVGAGYALNKTVKLGVRLTSYSNDDWRGGVVDEASALVTARLFSLGSLTLSAVGGADRDFTADEWGFSTGLRVDVPVSKRVSLVAESRIRAWFAGEKDLISGIGLSLSF